MRQIQLLSLVFSLCAITACERQALGETFEGQKHGGRSMQVTGDSPSPGAFCNGAAPAAEPPAIGGRVSWRDPAIVGQLLASGTERIRPPRTTPMLRGQRLPEGHAPALTGVGRATSQNN